ncbi:MAG: HEAT repeat domain-containing protein [Phycisphaerae bacterium]
MLRQLTTILALGVMAAAAFAQPAQSTQDAKPDPLKNLVQAISDPARAGQTLSALRATGDKDLAPLLVALSTSGNKDWRLSAMRALAEIVGKDAAEPIAQRLKSDPSMLIRSEALIALIALKACTKERLQEAINSPDESVQCIAARTAVQEGYADIALDTLKKLTASRDADTVALARMSLLKAGQKDQFEPLKALAADPKPSAEALTLLMEQIIEEKIEAGLEIARIVAKSDQPWELRLRAWRAVSAISPAADALREAIVASGQTVFRVQMLRVLAAREDSAAQVEALSSGDDSVAVLARMEKLRKAGGAEAAKAVSEAVKLGHPVVLDYVLDRAREDFAARGKDADFYTAGLLAIIQSVEADATSLKAEHVRAAKAATLLADMGTPAAFDGLKKVLAGRYGAPVRVAATGLLRTKNKAACDLVRPLLKSPYSELASDAAILLGRFADGDATEYLTSVVSHPDKHSELLVAMANWYLLKIAGRTREAGEALAREVK